jgi:hypothetical protein
MGKGKGNRVGAGTGTKDLSDKYRKKKQKRSGLALND